MRRRELADHRGIGIGRRELRGQHVTHPIVHYEVATWTGEQVEEDQLVILVRLQSEVATVQAVGKNRLIQLAHLERLRQHGRVLRADRAHEVPVHPLDVVHRSPYCRCVVSPD